MENRTPDLRIANATLYQLSYDPTRDDRRERGTSPLPWLLALGFTSPFIYFSLQLITRLAAEFANEVGEFMVFASQSAWPSGLSTKVPVRRRMHLRNT